MAEAVLAASARKCATCDRWSGVRQRGTDEESQIRFEDQQTEGRCNGGPWDGNIRDPLTRCGRWIPWEIK